MCLNEGRVVYRFSDVGLMQKSSVYLDDGVRPPFKHEIIQTRRERRVT